MIEKRHGVKLVPEDLPLDDKETYEIFCKGFTSGVFQFESSGMRDILRRYRPSRLEDLTALNALYRPGPIQGGMVDDFIERKWGRRAVQYDLPELKELLEETYGVIVYQEQVMQISNRVAGYSLGEADLLRRAMGKKKAEEMAQQRERFVAGAAAKGLPPKKQAEQPASAQAPAWQSGGDGLPGPTIGTPRPMTGSGPPPEAPFARERISQGDDFPKVPPSPIIKTNPGDPGTGNAPFVPAPPMGDRGAAAAPVPSCVLVGTQLVNFALRDVEGNPWEWKRHRRGKLVLFVSPRLLRSE